MANPKKKGSKLKTIIVIVLLVFAFECISDAMIYKTIMNLFHSESPGIEDQRPAGDDSGTDDGNGSSSGNSGASGSGGNTSGSGNASGSGSSSGNSGTSGSGGNTSGSGNASGSGSSSGNSGTSGSGGNASGGSGSSSGNSGTSGSGSNTSGSGSTSGGRFRWFFLRWKQFVCRQSHLRQRKQAQCAVGIQEQCVSQRPRPGHQRNFDR